MKRLTQEQVVAIHHMLILETGGLDGLRDHGALDSALHAPFQTFGGQYVYRSTEAKAAQLGYFLVNNHPFVDGNKRIGMLAMLVFLEANGISLRVSDQEMIETGLSLASGQMDAEQLLNWILQHS